MNFVIIMTDTQNREMVGAYGNPGVNTPCLDKLAASGLRFDRAYTTCPLCTPARSAIFSGIHSPVNGAWCNNAPPYPTFPLMGEIFQHYGYRTGYSGKWHLDGSGYFGDGEAGGGFEPDWWYDGKNYGEDIGEEMFKVYRSYCDNDKLRAAGFTLENIWGHRVANRAVDFLENIGDEPFVFVASFDEPHGPFVAPPEYRDSFDVSVIPRRPNFAADTHDKPNLQQLHAQNYAIQADQWEAYQESLRKHFACNSYIDSEIGRVIDAVDLYVPEDTLIIYTSDHGDMQGSHGQKTKGPMMYEEVTNIPFIVRGPACAAGQVTQVLSSHLDILPTMLDLANLPCPDILQGQSLRSVLQNPAEPQDRQLLMSFSRFAINHDDWGEFYPIRCLTDGHYKLVINLFDSDEFYDLTQDPYEMTNLIGNESVAEPRDRLHDALLDELDRIRDPFRSYQWGDREWRSVRKPFYHGGKRRGRPAGFPFQAVGVEADGSRT